MGVTGLWTVVQPCARPIKLETLNKKRLAVDASIWIYQFLKAVRDKEGNALRNSHVVGFFRRICKLLFFGIKPVFVFDGGAPTLKRQTIAGRKRRREGRREDAVRTAGKLLAVQMQRRAEEEERKRKDEKSRATRDEEEELPEELVYVDELQMTAQERQKNRQFKKKDAYHLPDLDVSLAEMGAPNDPRIMSQEELEEYARQFHSGEDINLYDFSKIDFESPFFLSLPASDRYNILNAARLRSRLRMGYSKDQLDNMFPDRMAFSKFQIERVRERNELTQRLMNINGMNGNVDLFGLNSSARIAGEKGKEYVLVKNDDVEGGWALGVVSNKDEGKREQPIDLDTYGTQKAVDEEAEWEDEDEGFEDVPIEGLNRLPKRTRPRAEVDHDEAYRAEEIAKKRRAVYGARKSGATSKPAARQPSPADDPDSLFVPETYNDATDDEQNDDLFEDVKISTTPNESEEEDDDLRRAIEMSLKSPPADAEGDQASAKLAHEMSYEKSPRVNEAGPAHSNESSDDEDMDLAAAFAESRRSKYRPRGPAFPGSHRSVSQDPASSPPEKTMDSRKGFEGPLPFESLNLGQSLLGKKKAKKLDEAQSGGFERPERERSAQPLPPWFTGDGPKGKFITHEAPEEESDEEVPNTDRPRILKRKVTTEVIDLDAPESQEVINIESSDEEAAEPSQLEITVDSETRMDDIADMTRALPPKAAEPDNTTNSVEAPLTEDAQTVLDQSQENASGSEEIIEWDPTDDEDSTVDIDTVKEVVPSVGVVQTAEGESSSPEFDVGGPTSPKDATPASIQRAASSSEAVDNEQADDEDLDETGFIIEDDEVEEPNEDGNSEEQQDIKQEENYYSDSDEELMKQLAVEAEEHARFASTLNQKSQAENAFDYERELKQLRNQQKKDRRDADEVTHIMITECQQLLRLFGLPYITAPMEAEAQCAELVELGLVDGIVTDDSDIFLFGGTRVYKNMFNQAKFVECYLASDLEKEYALDRRKLIRFAHLLGSDYTEGIPGIGPVTALEILTEFEKLEDFRDWWTKSQMGVDMADEHSAFRKKFKRNLSKLFLPPAFPDTRVDVAYFQPEVDSDPSSFQWGVPDLDALRAFLMATIGWSQERTDEVLVPVVRDMNRREAEGTQANITNFFSGGQGVGAFAPRRRAEPSGRMEKAFGRLKREAEKRRRAPEEDENPNEEREITPAGAVAQMDGEGARAATKGARPSKKRVPAVTGDDEDTSGDDGNEIDLESSKKASKKRRKKKR